MLDYRAGNIIEMTWFVRNHWDSGHLTDIPFREIKLIIADFAEEFEKLHDVSDWCELDYTEEITSFTNKMIAKELWSLFGEVPMNPGTEEIEEEWNGFLPGTHREEIWHWFEETFNVNVAEDLMNI